MKILNGQITGNHIILSNQEKGGEHNGVLTVRIYNGDYDFRPAKDILVKDFTIDLLENGIHIHGQRVVYDWNGKLNFRDSETDIFKQRIKETEERGSEYEDSAFEEITYVSFWEKLRAAFANQKYQVQTARVLKQKWIPRKKREVISIMTNSYVIEQHGGMLNFNYTDKP